MEGRTADPLAASHPRNGPWNSSRPDRGRSSPPRSGAARPLGHPQPKALSTPAFLAWVLGLTLLVFGLSFLAGSETRLVGLLIFLPAIAASVGTVRQTQAASVWATAGGAISVARNPGYHLDDAITLVLTMLFAVLAVFGARWRIARDTELLRLRSTAAVIQQHILHPLPEFTSQVRVDGIFEPLQEDKLFGGDIYDVADTPYGTRVLIGDVQGKGSLRGGCGVRRAGRVPGGRAPRAGADRTGRRAGDVRGPAQRLRTPLG